MNKTTITTKFASVTLVALAATALAACSSQQQSTQLASGACTPTGAMGDAVASFYEPGAVVKATPIKKRTFVARAIQPKRTMGASLFIKAQPDMSAPFLHRALSCHTRSNNPAHPNDPLHPASGSIAGLDVRESGGNFVVDVLAGDRKVGQEIWQRADALSAGGSVNVEQVATGHGPQSF